MQTKVFISYAKEDKIFAEKLYKDLHQVGIKAWIDSADILPGQKWEIVIEEVIRESRYFLALLSSRSVGKTGYVQKEIRHALKIAQEYPPDKIYIIPLRINECKPAYEDLTKLQFLDFFPDYDKSFTILLRSFEYEIIEKPILIQINIGLLTGTISTLMEKLYGFVTFNKKYFFFHASELVDVQFDELRLDDVVYFNICLGPKGLVATNVQRA